MILFTVVALLIAPISFVKVYSDETIDGSPIAVTVAAAITSPQEGSIEPETIFIRNSRFEHPPSMIIDSDGSMHAVWSYQYAKIDQNKNVIVRQLFRDAYVPDIAIFNDRIHIVWSDYRDPEGNTELYYMQLDNNGTIVINERRLTDAINVSDYPSMAVDNDGNVHIVWEDWRYTSRIIGTRPDCPQGSSLNFNLWSFELFKEEESCEIYETRNLRGVYYTKLDANGNKIIDDIRVTPDDNITRMEMLRPRVAFDGTDQLHVVWWDRRDADRLDTSNEAEVYYTKLDLKGNKLLPDIRVTNARGDSAWPDLDVDSNGNAHVVWFDDRLSLDGGTYEIYRTTMSKDGTKVLNDTKISSIPKYSTAGWPNIAVDENDDIHVVWSEVWTVDTEPPAGYKSGIYYTRINSDGSIEQSPAFVAGGGGYSDIVVSDSKVYVLSDSGNSINITVVPEFPLVTLVFVSALAGCVVFIRFRKGR
jgi:hypothetical protein